MKRLLLIVLPLLLIVGCSEVEGQQQLIPVVTTYKDGNISGITLRIVTYSVYEVSTENHISVVGIYKYKEKSQTHEKNHI